MVSFGAFVSLPQFTLEGCSGICESVCCDSLDGLYGELDTVRL